MISGGSTEIPNQGIMRPVKLRWSARLNYTRLSSVNIEELIQLALQVRNFAYTPYSGFKVGAVVESRGGQRYSGCNIENSSYGLSICAERIALGKAISEGARSFSQLVV